MIMLYFNYLFIDKKLTDQKAQNMELLNNKSIWSLNK